DPPGQTSPGQKMPQAGRILHHSRVYSFIAFSIARRAKTFRPALAIRQRLDGDKLCPRHGCHYQLGDPVPRRYRVRLGRIRVQQGDPDLATVPRVDRSRAVDNGYAVTRGETA